VNVLILFSFKFHSSAEFGKNIAFHKNVTLAIMG